MSTTTPKVRVVPIDEVAPMAHVIAEAAALPKAASNSLAELEADKESSKAAQVVR